MKSKSVRQHRERLDAAFKRVTEFGGDPELQSHWARYLCVIVSGFIETSVRAIYSEYASNKSAPFVANFAETKLKDFQNPKMGKIVELARCFSLDWATELELKSEGATKDAIDSIVANKNDIAHGRSVGITIHRIREYYTAAVPLLDLIEEQCGR